ncbi:MAG: hypothetical protein ACMUHM_05630 [Thermoplasmatota archaeon]
MARRKKDKGKRSHTMDEGSIPDTPPLESFLSTPDNSSSDIEKEAPKERDNTKNLDDMVIEEELRRPEKVMEVISTPASTDISLPGTEITAREARKFLDGMKVHLKKTSTAGIYFHNDMDGLNGALFVRAMIRAIYGNSIDIHASPLEYKELQMLKLDDGITYIFIDMDIDLKGDNVFRIDHHGPSRDLKIVDERTFLLTPPENDYEYPSTATALCAYLEHVSTGGGGAYFEFLNRGPWQNDQFKRLLILLASVCDNLWHLNFLIDIPIKKWIPDKEEERYLVLISISASLLLGENDKRDDLINRFFGMEITPEIYLGNICQRLTGARNIMDFTMTVSKEAEVFYNRIFFNLTDSIERSLKTLERDKDTLKKLEDSMPIDMRGNREKMMELLNTRGDLNLEHWRRVQFYGKEMDKIEAKINVEEKRLFRLRSAKKMISTEKGPRLCVMLPMQSSFQVKGIIASLLYYMGWKNVVIEERGSEAYWGSRGFTKEFIGDVFSNLSLGYEELKDYLFMEKVFKDLPEVFKRTLNISRNISYYKTYSGGMGGRGLIHGGVLTGKVPRVFSLLEETGDMEEKVRELMKYKQLGTALQGLTEGQSTVSTAQALRAKFKSTGWMVLQLVQGRQGADIIQGNFNMAIMNLVGYTERIGIELQEHQPYYPQMDHGRFDVID